MKAFLVFLFAIFIVAIMAIAISDPYEEKATETVETEGVTFADGMYGRFIDHEVGVACYYLKTYRSAISCVKIRNKLLLEEMAGE